MVYRRYVEYYQFIIECKNHCVNSQSYELACDLRNIEKNFFYKDDKLNLAPVSQWYFEPDIDFDEVDFVNNIQKLSDKYNVKWLVRDLKLKSVLGADILFSR